MAEQVVVFSVEPGEAIPFGEDIPTFDDLRALTMSHQLQENRVREICKQIGIPQQVRGLVWQHLLGTRQKGLESISDWDFDMRLNNSATVLVDCQTTCANKDLPTNSNTESRTIVEDMQFIVSLVVKVNGLTYHHGLSEVAAPFFALGLSRSTIFNCLSSVISKYAQPFFQEKIESKQRIFKLLRLLLMYHDPILCKQLDDHHISPEVYASTWFSTLFSLESQIEAVLCLWDHLFVADEGIVLLFFALAVIMSQRDTMLKQSAQVCMDRLCLFSLNSPFDVLQLWHAALRYQASTPASFTVYYNQALAMESGEGNNGVSEPWNAPCLPVRSEELAAAQIKSHTLSNSFKFFILDCRPTEMYVKGHLATGLHCGYDVLKTSMEIDEFIDNLKPMKGRYHMCLVTAGDGKQTHWIAKISLSLRNAGFPYVGYAQEGFQGLKTYLPPELQVVETEDDYVPPTIESEAELNVDNDNNNNNNNSKNDASVEEHNNNTTTATPSSSSPTATATATATATTHGDIEDKHNEHDDADDMPAPSHGSHPPPIRDLDAYLEALALFKELADNGDADKQLALGRMYFLAHGVPQCLSKALHYYTLAAERGDAEAHNSLGFMYSKGVGTACNMTSAIDHYLAASEAGNADAAANLGFLYSNGKGVTHNLAKSVFWYKKAAELGNSRAQHNLAIFYETGKGVELDLTTALYWYRKSAEQGNPKAINVLGVIYWKGRGVPKDPMMAYMFFTLGMKHGSPLSIRNASVIGPKMSPEDLARAEKLASEWEKRYVKKKNADTIETHPFHSFRITMHA